MGVLCDNKHGEDSWYASKETKRTMDALYLDFVNSEFRDFRGRWVRDELEQASWVEAFLLKWELHVESPLDTTARALLVALRTLLSRVIEILTKEEQISVQDQEALNAVLLKVPLHRHLRKEGQGFQMEMVPMKRDWEWVQAEIVASFVYMLALHDTRRLKRCANPHCRWVFYDESKSRTKQYCTSDKCANLMKVRRFRAHHTEALSS
jgi:predicted RNA-binding Zn ribbon-like protein